MIRNFIIICWVLSLGIVMISRVTVAANLSNQETKQDCCTKSNKEADTKQKSECCQKDNDDSDKDCCGDECNGNDCHCPSNNITTALLNSHPISKIESPHSFIAKRFLLFNVTKIQFGHTVIWIPPKVA